MSSLSLLVGCRSVPTASTPLEVPTTPLGVLRPVAALELTGDRDFGGWSGAALERSGAERTLWAVSDAGGWIRLALRTDAEDRLVGADEICRGTLVDEAGRALSGKREADAEGLAITPDRFVVSFEHDHRLLAYGHGFAGPARRIPLPEGFTAPENGGIEALGRSEGDQVVLVEGDEGATGPHPGWIGGTTGTPWAPLSVARTADLRPVELAPLGPDLLLVERAYTEEAGTTIRLSRLPGTALRGGAELAPIELGVLRQADDAVSWALPVDNFEAAAADGDTVWLLSDDNFSSRQRTLLLQLRWTPPDPEVRGARVERYPLEGRDERELVRSCASACPRDDAGNAVRGLTAWSLRWTWDRLPAADGCRVGRIASQVDVTVRLPGWEPPRDADPELVAAFPAYLEALATHEQGHVDLVHEAAREGEARLAALGCDEAHDAVKSWLDDLRRRQAELDLATHSGHAQGAQLRGHGAGASAP